MRFLSFELIKRNNIYHYRNWATSYSPQFKVKYEAVSNY